MTPIIALKQALRAALAADAALLAQLGGPKIYDDVPRAATAPYVAFGDVTVRDNGTATDRGHITELQIILWSRQGGSREALALADLVHARLDDGTLPLAGHRMVQCRVTSTEARRTPDKDLTRATLRLRIVTEVI